MIVDRRNRKDKHGTKKSGGNKGSGDDKKNSDEEERGFLREYSKALDLAIEENEREHYRKRTLGGRRRSSSRRGRYRPLILFLEGGDGLGG